MIASKYLAFALGCSLKPKNISTHSVPLLVCIHVPRLSVIHLVPQLVTITNTAWQLIRGHSDGFRHAQSQSAFSSNGKSFSTVMR